MYALRKRIRRPLLCVLLTLELYVARYVTINCVLPCSDENAMEVSVLYRNKEVINCHVTDRAGCIIAYDPIGDQGKLLDDAGLKIIREQVRELTTDLCSGFVSPGRCWSPKLLSVTDKHDIA